MYFEDAVGVEAGLLEVAVDVRRVDETAVLHPARPAAQGLKAGVRRRGAVEVEAMAVEAPRQLRVVAEPARVGQGDEVEAELLVGRIRLPESLVAAEVRQA